MLVRNIYCRVMCFGELSILLGIFVSIPFSIALNDSSRSNQDDLHFADIFCHMADGDLGRLFRPNYTGPPTTVVVDISIDSFGEVNAIRKTIVFNIYLRQRWIDVRYKHQFHGPITPNLGKGHPANYIWVPDTVIVNMKDAKRLSKNDKLDIHPNGSIFWGTMLTLEIECDMDFHDFPLDTQTCMFGFESYAHNYEQIKYEWYWKRQVHFVSDDVEQFEIMNYTTSTSIDKYEAGKFVVLKVYIEFQRQLQVTILQIFFPFLLAVCVSWVTLWMHKRSPSARVGIGTTTLLTLTMVWLSANKKIPSVSYVKAIDIYFMISFCFILGVLFEYVVVMNINFAKWKHERNEKSTRRRNTKSNANTSSTIMELQMLRDQYQEIEQNSGTAKSFQRRYNRIEQNHRKGINIDHDENFKNKATYREMVDEGFDLGLENLRRRYPSVVVGENDGVINQSISDDDDRSSHTSDESDCSDDDVAGTKNSIFLDKRIISMFLDTRPSTLDIVCRFLFPFCYCCFAVYWWMYYLGKRKDFQNGWCSDATKRNYETMKNCTFHSGHLK